MLAPQIIALVNHVLPLLGLGGGVALTVRVSITPVTRMIVHIYALHKVDKEHVPEIMNGDWREGEGNSSPTRTAIAESRRPAHRGQTKRRRRTGGGRKGRRVP